MSSFIPRDKDVIDANSYYNPAFKQTENTLGSSQEPIDITNATPETVSSSNIRDIFDRLLQYQEGVNQIDSPSHIIEMGTVLNESLDALKRIGDHTLSTVFNQGMTRGEIKDRDISLNIQENINSTPIPMSANEALVHEIEHAITKYALDDP